MGQVLHGSARTTEAVPPDQVRGRLAIQHSEESLRVLAKRHGINQKTVAKWKKRTAVKDLPTGPRDAHSTVLSIEGEAIIVAFRKHTLLPLDACLYALQATIPHLTRSSLHRCLQRHGISRLPEVAGDKQPKHKFKTYPIGLGDPPAHRLIRLSPHRHRRGPDGRGQAAPVRGDRPHQQVRVVELHQQAGKMIAAQFLRNLVAAVPYAIHTVLTDNPVLSDCRRQAVEGSIQFTNHARHKYAFHHIFDRVCDEHGIEHRLTKVKHPWTNGQSLPRRRPGSNA